MATLSLEARRRFSQRGRQIFFSDSRKGSDGRCRQTGNGARLSGMGKMEGMGRTAVHEPEACVSHSAAISLSAAINYSSPGTALFYARGCLSAELPMSQRGQRGLVSAFATSLLDWAVRRHSTESQPVLLVPALPVPCCAVRPWEMHSPASAPYCSIA